jgi:hypothetical protein
MVQFLIRLKQDEVAQGACGGNSAIILTHQVDIIEHGQCWNKTRIIDLPEMPILVTTIFT